VASNWAWNASGRVTARIRLPDGGVEVSRLGCDAGETCSTVYLLGDGEPRRVSRRRSGGGWVYEAVGE
jgi:hypothetical protein